METLTFILQLAVGAFGLGIGIGCGIAIGLDAVMRFTGDGRTVMLTFARHTINKEE